MAQRIGNVLYVGGIVFAAIFAYMSLSYAADGCYFGMVCCYALGWAARYILSGRTNPLSLH